MPGTQEGVNKCFWKKTVLEVSWPNYQLLSRLCEARPRRPADPLRSTLTELNPTYLLSNNLGLTQVSPIFWQTLQDKGLRSLRRHWVKSGMLDLVRGRSGCFSSCSWVLLSPSSPASPGNQSLFPPSCSPQPPPAAFPDLSWRSCLLPGFVVWPLPCPHLNPVSVFPLLALPHPVLLSLSPRQHPPRSLSGCHPPPIAPFLSCNLAEDAHGTSGVFCGRVEDHKPL